MAGEHHEQGTRCERAALAELKAIKRLLALQLLRAGAGQQQVAKAAGVATLAVNVLANAGVGNKKQRKEKARRR